MNSESLHCLAASKLLIMDPLRVAIYPYIPDLADDQLRGLTKYIAKEFKAISGVDIIISSEVDPYDLAKMDSTYLGSGSDAYDVLEVDTILLGELVDTGKLQQLDGIFTVNDTIYAKTTVEAVKILNKLYGVPTLQCANFLTEISDQLQQPLLKDWSSFKEMKTVMDPAHARGIRLVGNFSGSWTLPNFYLGAYIDKHGPKDLYKGIDSNPADDMLLVANMKDYNRYGALPNGTNPTIDGTYKRYPQKAIDAIVASDHVFMYGYSEVLGTVRNAAKKKQKSVLNTVSPPLDRANYLLTYTDATIVNKSRYNVSQERAKVIEEFVNFYTSLKFRLQYALGEDLPKEVVRPRYVLPACKDFYKQDAVTKDENYMMFHKALDRSSPAANHDLYDKRKGLETKLKVVLGIQ